MQMLLYNTQIIQEDKKDNIVKHNVSELFGPTIQGEGVRTGVMSVWVRYWGCNLECNGFGQKEPTKPETYVLPYNTLNLINVKVLEDLPVFEYGCDSSYSWSKKYRHLAKAYQTEELADKLYSLLPGGKFKHPVTDQTYDLCLTGGETMMQQKQIVELISYMIEQDNFPYDIQIETNGTRPMSQELAEFIQKTTAGVENGKINWHFSISPKLWNVAGEKDEDAWKPEVIKRYFEVNPAGWLKFVVNNREETWEELNCKTTTLREIDVKYPVYVMPVGSTKNAQEDSAVISAIANRAIKEGYHISGRLHCTIWGNTVGV